MPDRTVAHGIRSSATRWIVLGASLALGCASAPPKQWNRPGASSADFYADRAYCQQNAEVQYGGDAGLNLLAYFLTRGEFDGCMKQLGWLEGSPPLQADTSPSGGTDPLQQYFQSKVESVRATMPAEPVCDLGVALNSTNDTLTFVGPIAHSGGLRAGDRILTVDGSPFSGALLQEKKFGDSVGVALQRDARSLAFEVPCSDGRQILQIILETLEEAARRQWVDCILGSLYQDEVLGQYSGNATLRVVCTGAMRRQQNSPPNVTDARYRYEHQLRLIRESRFEPEGVESIRSVVLTEVTWFETNGFQSVASDLRAQFEAAIGEGSARPSSDALQPRPPMQKGP